MSKEYNDQNCALCTEKDSEHMVQCDSCDAWFHFVCVGVSQDVEDRNWNCKDCQDSSVSSNTTLKANDNNENQHSQNITAAANPMSNNDAISFQLTNTQTAESTSAVYNVLDIKTPKSLEFQRLEEERKLSQLRLQEQKRLDDEYLTKKYQLLSGSSKTVLTQELSTTPRYLPAASYGQNTTHNFIQKDLPKFSGYPEDWPLFISSYETSNAAYGFSNIDNLLRLQACLKGKAFESVRSLLLMPSTVPDVIETLRLLYGRPELIINTLIQQVRKELPPRIDKADTIINFSIRIRNLCATITAYVLQEHMNNPLLKQELIDKLPPQLKLDWAMYSISKTPVDLRIFSDWLYNIAKAMSTIVTPYTFVGNESKEKMTAAKPKNYLHMHNEISSNKNNDNLCLICNESHTIDRCIEFRSLALSEKWSAVRKFKLCKCCLRVHNFSKCRNLIVCNINDCKAKHNRLLHNNSINLNNNNNLKSDTQHTSVARHNLQHHTQKSVLLRIVPVTLHGNGISAKTYALLDEGSSVTLIEKDTADKLKLEGEKERLCLKWTGGTVREENDSKKVTMKISSSSTSYYYKINNARTVNKLELPKQTVSLKKIVEQFDYLKNIPIQSYENAVPTILIGVDNWKLGIPLKIVEGKWSEPFATKTRLGWVLSGNLSEKAEHQEIFHHYEICECNKALHQTLKEFIECNDIVTSKSTLLSKEEKRSMLILKETVRRVKDRYESGLLWKYPNIQLPNSYNMALKRLQCLERQSKCAPELLYDINDQIRNLVDKGYARKLTEKEMKKAYFRVWYLPIFIVKNPNKPNKIRLVWDAAATVEGISLNSVLSKGPDQLIPLTTVLQRFREKKIAVTGDIKEMFHQIRVREEDQHVQRFLWRNGNSDQPPDVYVMQALTFGASCSPSIAQYIKNENAKEFFEQYPEAVRAITDCHYVDDLLISVDSPTEAISIAKQIEHIHSKGGFKIHNWGSNSSKVLNALNITNHENKDLQSNQYLQLEKILGLWWRAKDDNFTFIVKYAKVDQSILKKEKMPTKRQLLQILMSIFDPLGFLSHYLVALKILLQKMWTINVDWDEVIPEELQKEWLQWLHMLPQVETVSIPRCYSLLTCKKEVDVQLHTFVDASQEAMAAVSYFRITAAGETNVALVAAKTKVAPKQLTSIPRLELQAAVIGARLSNSILQSHKVIIREKIFWSDSKTVLSWLKSDAKKYKPYVMHRVAEISECTSEKEWRWIPSKLNAADIATKRQKSPLFDPNGPWFAGPYFLKEPEENWPNTPNDYGSSGAEELRAKYLFTHFTSTEERIVDFERFSNWSHLNRIVAWIIRYMHNLKSKAEKKEMNTGPLNSSELQYAYNKIIIIVQNETYGDEITLLKKGKKLQKSSPLFNCSPYIDDDGLLRMRGRIDKVAIDANYLKRPIFLPKNHPITNLIVKYYHLKYYHQCQETIVNEIRQTFWIPRLRVLVKFITKQCNYCREQKAKPLYPEMAPLPAERLAVFTKPFTYVGVDYFGPILVTSGRKKEKRWGVLFTCLTVRAIHIEIAYTLTTDSCIVAIRNFMARRGTPITFFSDNGTNFKGAEKELREEFGKVNKTMVGKKLNSSTTEWKFIPPSAPHMGGCWERLIGSTKKVLYHVCRNKRLTDESLRCFLMETENIINSRPLTYMSTDSSSSEALTPNHFLLGSSSGSKSPGEFNTKDLYLRRNWRLAQKMTDEFWKRWISEYLPTLTRRPKWCEKVENIKEGDLVLIVDENSSRNTWPKGIVIQTIVAEDGQVRRATVKTSTGVYERPVVKLALVGRKKEGETSAESSRFTEGEC